MLENRLYSLLKTTVLKPIVVAGDIIIDKYVNGSVGRISPEAPVQVFEVTSENDVLGGAANVAANVAALGAETRIVGLVGYDKDAATVKALLKKSRIKINGIVSDSSRSTTRKARIISMHQQMLRIDRENRHPVSRKIGERLLKRFEESLKGCGGVIISDYAKGAVPEWVLKRMFALCKKAKIQAVVDPKGGDYSKYKGATLITPNQIEASTATSVDVNNDQDLHEIASRILKITGSKKLVITRGSDGMNVYSKSTGNTGLSEGTHLPAEALEIFDVSGAGDTVIAILGALTFSGVCLEDAARIANLAAAIGVGHFGPWPVSKSEIFRRIKASNTPLTKLMTISQVNSFASSMRAQKKRIVFTNGCFDLLHAGHVSLLNKARAFGAVLIVGLNTDQSIRRLKGDKRPLINESDRVEVLSALDCVDSIVLFGENTPLKLIKEIKPDVIVKGADYKIAQVIGRAEIEKAGGRVELIKLTPGRSTTNVLDTILKKYNKQE
ncbi:MAG TPA: D-glycero-beta-D-manno-heptose 1-phosphate adenylyltransferase [Nitrospinota bacterium]|nr:D-glycero-beta-D-manno-heptose 1-phosphate adenylyltransferase [Nitrospinota bacterium]|tara:strand:- start:303237 stop:304727 length:1491 start_codon:yes stop_codon:yes gene_type:complete